MLEKLKSLSMGAKVGIASGAVLLAELLCAKGYIEQVH